MKSSLFVGRWQPFHKGHKALIETRLKKGKPVLIAVRNTKLNEKNPYTVSERFEMIHEELKEYGNLVRLIEITDIDEICWGRDVGYGLNRIDLPENIERISATKKRNDLVDNGSE